ncbi:MAG: hypothetical protein JWO35_895 [Candidatus Saccharibacteria bacterium]|nr:hypothetical protein [Candidatus Saccharibacteria bacterium]
MGEVVYFNEAARAFHEQPVLGPPTKEEWRLMIMDMAERPRLVAIAEREILGYTNAVEEADLEEIEQLGKGAIHEMIRSYNKMHQPDFEIAVAMCEQDVRDRNVHIEWDEV